MKKLLMIILAAVMAFTLLTSCTSSRQDGTAANPTRIPLNEMHATFHPVIITDDGNVSFGDNDAQAADILSMPAFTEQFRVSGGSAEGSYYKVITDFEQLKQLVGDPEGKTETRITEDTFIMDFVVAVFVTVRSGGYGFEVESASNDAHTVSADIKVTPPQAGTDTTQAFETHCILLGFDAADYYDDLVYNITVNGEPVAEGAELPDM